MGTIRLRMTQKEIAEGYRAQIPVNIMAKMIQGLEISKREKEIVNSKGKSYVLGHTKERGQIRIKPQLRNLSSSRKITPEQYSSKITPEEYTGFSGSKMFYPEEIREAGLDWADEIPEEADLVEVSVDKDGIGVSFFRDDTEVGSGWSEPKGALDKDTVNWAESL